jgi:hypothetical protein
MLADGMLSDMTKHSQPVLGIDIGRVIIGAADPSGKADNSDSPWLVA